MTTAILVYLGLGALLLALVIGVKSARGGTVKLGINALAFLLMWPVALVGAIVAVVLEPR